MSSSAFRRNIVALVEAARKGELGGKVAMVGAACGALGGELLRTPGASSLLLDVHVPYDGRATQGVLEGVGVAVDSLCSREAADGLARAAKERAERILLRGGRDAGAGVVGLGMTAAFQTTRDRRGKDQAFLTARSSELEVFAHVLLERSAGREAQENVVASVGVAVLGMALKAPSHVLEDVKAIDGLHWGDSIDESELKGVGLVEVSTRDVESGLRRVLKGEGDLVLFDASTGLHGNSVRHGIPGAVILSGNFHPLHDGHRELLRAAHSAAGNNGVMVFEMAVRNAEKGDVEGRDVEKRVEALLPEIGAHGGEGGGGEVGGEGGDGVVLVAASRLPLFVDKARVWPKGQFVVGFDTAKRILDPKFYNDDHDSMIAALSTIQSAGCSFLVAPRAENPADGSGKVLDLTNLTIPLPFQSPPLFRPIPGFFSPLSSTQLRRTSSK